eukprot:scaffold221403_cov31-Tisochrysis_lutea.AAC.1
MQLSLLLCLLPSTALGALIRPVAGGSSWRAITRRRSDCPVLVTSGAKETLVRELRYSFVPSTAAQDAIAELAATPAAVPSDALLPCIGRFRLLAHQILAAKLKEARAPLETVKLVVSPEGALIVELDLFVGGAVVGLRLKGMISATDKARQLKLSLQSAEWFEPNEEFGVSRQIGLAREKFDGTLARLPYETTLNLSFSEDDLCIMRDDVAPESSIVLQRIQGSKEADAAMAAAMARAAAGKRGSVAFDDKGQYLGES